MARPAWTRKTYEMVAEFRAAQTVDAKIAARFYADNDRFDRVGEWR